MLKLCADSICKPLEKIFKTCLWNGRFQLECKKANVIPIHKKMTNKLSETIVQFHFYLTVGNYLIACFMTLCLFFSKNIFSSNQSGFRPGDSCINQLLSVNHEILIAFDVVLEVRVIFLDISKDFDKVWLLSKIFKLR